MYKPIPLQIGKKIISHYSSNTWHIAEKKHIDKKKNHIHTTLTTKY